MSTPPISDGIATVSGKAMFQGRQSLPTDLISTQGVQGAHDVRHGQLSPPLAPEIQVNRTAEFHGSGVSDGRTHGRNHPPKTKKKNPKKKKPAPKLNAAAPAFVPTFQNSGYGIPEPDLVSAVSQQSTSELDSANDLVWQNSLTQRPATQDYMVSHNYPTIQHHPVSQQAPGFPYPASQYAVPPYIFHQYLTPQYGVQLAPSMPLQMIPMFSTVQQAMQYQHYLASRAIYKASVEREQSLPFPSPSKGHRKRNSQGRHNPAALHQSEHEESMDVYVGYYFKESSGKADQPSFVQADTSPFLPLLPSQGHFALGFEVNLPLSDPRNLGAFLPLLPTNSLGNNFEGKLT